MSRSPEPDPNASQVPPGDRGLLRPPAGPAGFAGPRRGRIARLAMKELRETLRDRRTIGTLLLMPILVYPLLSLAFQRFLLTQLRPVAGTVYRIAVESEDAQRLLTPLLDYGGRLLHEQMRQAERSPASDEPAAPDLSLGETMLSPLAQPPADGDFEIEVVPQAGARMSTLHVDLGMRLEWHGSRGVVQGLPLESQWDILVFEGSPRSEAALAFVHRRLQAVNVQALGERLVMLGRSPRLLIETSREPLDVPGGAGPFSLATLVPLILILMTMTGAVYPAIDLTAGERERGTLEALVAAPVPRMGLLLAKYVAVLTVALLTAGVNLAAMTVTVAATGLGPLLFGPDGLSPPTIAAILGLLVLLAGFFSAVVLALTSFARSFKEAQAYLIPLMLVSLAPGMLSLVPGLQLSGVLAVVPLANIVLLARDMFEHTVDPAMGIVVIGSTALYALGAISVAARVFGTDAILYGSEGSWSDVLRRPAAPRSAPTPATALLCLALLFPFSVLTAAVLARLQDVPLPTRLVVASLGTAALFGGVPLVAAAIRRIDLRSGFALRAARPAAWLAAALLGISLWPLVYTATISLAQLARAGGLELFDPRLVEHVRGLAEEFRTLPLVVILLSLAIAPAVFEELFFRGFLFTALRQRYRPAATIAASAALFALFHVVVRDVLAPERLLPSLALGLVLGWVRHTSGSVLPGTLLHACHNALLLSLVYYQPQLEQVAWLNVRGWMGLDAGAGHLPVTVLAVAAVLALAGGVLVSLSTPSHDEPQR